ncbi:MAG: GGDEF domain-containing protein [Alphaproteobacteria bacterium]
MALASARDTAFATIDGLTGLGLAPTPTNYSVWHSHISGDNPGLSRSIQDLVARAIPITDELLSDFWRRFCAPAMDPAIVSDAGERLGRMMASIADTISGAGAATTGFTEALARFGDEIVAAVRMPDMASVMRDATRRMLVETKRMVEHSRGLDGEMRGASREVQALRHDLEEARRQAMSDPLTSVTNRKAFDERLRREMAAAEESGDDLSLVLLDIDHFKRFNDSFGHVIGDEALKLVAHTLVASVKGRDMVARYGGEEFAVILPSTSLPNALGVASGLGTAVKGRRMLLKSTGRDLGRITVSLGVARYRPGEAPADLVRRADAALYAAKGRGRDMACDEGVVEEEAREAG